MQYPHLSPTEATWYFWTQRFFASVYAISLENGREAENEPVKLSHPSTIESSADLRLFFPDKVQRNSDRMPTTTLLQTLVQILKKHVGQLRQVLVVGMHFSVGNKLATEATQFCQGQRPGKSETFCGARKC